MADFTMPSLGADMEAGTLVEWRVKPGDAVKRGQVVAEVETQKGIIEVEIWQDGIVRELVVPEGTTVPVGTVLARLEGGAESVGATPAPEPESAPPSRRPASPAARKRALELGVSLDAVTGTGPHGAITLADIEAVAGAKPAPAAPVPATPATPVTDPRAAMRRAIAAAMSRANREIPHYHLATDIDMSVALAWLARENASRPVEKRLLPAVLLIKAVALACRQFPELNGFWTDDAFRKADGVHVGFAIAMRGGGLIAPAIKDADARSLDELMSDLAGLIERTRRGGLRSSELSDATITITSLGDRGVEVVHGVIYPPQVALVGFGRVTDRPVAAGGTVVARPVMTATLAGDHRATDGHEGAAFLAFVRKTLEDPP